MAKNEKFFDEQKDQSAVKAAIIDKYFDAWSKVILPIGRERQEPIAYIDLFAGPGRYKDGAKSTPLMILERAINNPELSRRLVTLFNDADKDKSASLQEAINNLLGINTLRYLPMVKNEEVGSNIVEDFENGKLVPTLFFVDPWGYKGLSLRLINSVLKDWGCDCIFFFNYNRINMGLSNDAVKSHLDALFGEERANKLRAKLEPLNPVERELAIVEELSQALKDGGRFVLPFRFKDKRGTRTSHHLIFVSKNFRGYEIMKEIMAKQSSEHPQGVASFEYNLATKGQPLLFEYSRPLDDLEGLLLKDFAGRSLTTRAIYEEHCIDKPYILSNYKNVLKNLDDAGKVQIKTHTGKIRRKGTFGDNIVVTFPKIS